MTAQGRVCAVTMVRNGGAFLPRWIAHYRQHLGPEGVVVVLDGLDQPLPDASDVCVLRLPHRQMSRAKGDRDRAGILSDLAAGLLRRFDRVIATDVDEFLIVDPQLGESLPEFLLARRGPVISALGIDVGQSPGDAPLNPGLPLLTQRAFARLDSRYTKASVIAAPLRWGSGMHRVKGRNFHIAPGLYLFHFGMADCGVAANLLADNDRLSAGWHGHARRRMKLFDAMVATPAVDGDLLFDTARRRQTWLRPVYALNKPGQIPRDTIIRIPDRFAALV